MKKPYKILLFSLSFIFLLITFLVKLNLTNDFDKFIYDFIINFKNDNVTNFFKVITDLGDTIAIISILILSFILFKNKIYPKLMALNICCIVGINQLLKHIIRRPRPDIFRMIEESGFSFPSGHSMASFGFYGLLIYMIYKSKLNKKIKVFLIIMLSLLILLIGISRIYLGVHYASDVIGGFIMSFICLIVLTNFSKKHFEKV